MNWDEVKVFPTIKDLKEARTCWKECGILKLKVYQDKWIVKQKLGIK